jgi:hypothetical protein
MVIMVITMTEKDSHEMNENFQRNLEKELREIERKKHLNELKYLFQEWEDYDDRVGSLAVKYFGTYLGALLLGMGLLLVLHIYGWVQFSLLFDIAMVLISLGAVLILASSFVSRIIPRREGKGGDKND